MIAKIIKHKVRIRTIIFVLLTLLAYGFTFFYLFGNHDIFGSIVCVFFLYIFYHLASLDIKKFKAKYILLIILSLTIIDLSILFLSNWDFNLWLILSIISLNAALYALFDSLNVISFNSITYFLKWWYIFTLLITTTYSLALVWMFSHFPLTCEWLQAASDKLIEFVEKPFTFSVDKLWVLTDGWQGDLITQFESDVGESVVDEIPVVEDALIKVKNTDIGVIDSSGTLSPIMLQFNQWKSNSIDQIMWQQESYSVWMCDMLLDEINSKYNLKEFSLSVVLLIYLMLFGFVRVAIFIMSFIWFLVFKILYWVWLYKIKKVKKLVNEIK
jgi:hypothetical protein